MIRSRKGSCSSSIIKNRLKPGVSALIRTFLFDMGNVLAFFSHDKMCEQMGGLCGRSRTEIQNLLIESGMQWEYERGKLTPAEFHNWFEEVVETKVDYNALQTAGSDIFELNSTIIPVLDALKSQGYRLVLLSNTCVSHFDFIWKEFDLSRLGNRFESLGTKVHFAGIFRCNNPFMITEYFVAIGPRLFDITAANRTTASRLIDDDDRLFQQLLLGD